MRVGSFIKVRAPLRTSDGLAEGDGDGRGVGAPVGSCDGVAVGFQVVGAGDGNGVGPTCAGRREGMP